MFLCLISLASNHDVTLRSSFFFLFDVIPSTKNIRNFGKFQISEKYSEKNSIV